MEIETVLYNQMLKTFQLGDVKFGSEREKKHCVSILC